MNITPRHLEEGLSFFLLDMKFGRWFIAENTAPCAESQEAINGYGREQRASGMIRPGARMHSGGWNKPLWHALLKAEPSGYFDIVWRICYNMWCKKLNPQIEWNIFHDPFNYWKWVSCGKKSYLCLINFLVVVYRFDWDCEHRSITSHDALIVHAWFWEAIRLITSGSLKDTVATSNHVI